MRQQRRNSRALTKAERRIEGLQMIDPDLNFGNEFSIANYNGMVQQLREKLAAYNQAKTLVEKTQTALVDAERVLNNYSEHMLLNVASRYGKNSDEYGMAGGTRKSERRKPRPAAKPDVISAEA
ncbi:MULTISPECIES: hypothetical protein [unclassified Tolypothrix]|uniref:hypothetical protein n=1 Tax=unclassified Tolypothrix TaxID=2649714 RepID=UPI0005EAADB5|nr:MULTISPECIES: hypothetical protein [unclassified Tolypothrix]BAY90809.1 hypothetical protein NIES3275_28260 [Microchaete diplosiphon NIES-3275]EKF04340.1 putative DNA-directed RNA polymerase [Tolypothrix sp. PCC 7601]MBE9085444.1 hypothetical protein [Tolypothrix sp. LEGE 11397]UYD24939.1 hypothetical protein HGR01_26525 [Tolypothrix sp. PCC 7712]UYD32828.1 hypothetical protein HG267_28110 [Tolypothrix sp. PCC 7601]